jgi:hypothetical protein
MVRFLGERLVAFFVDRLVERLVIFFLIDFLAAAISLAPTVERTPAVRTNFPWASSKGGSGLPEMPQWSFVGSP